MVQQKEKIYCNFNHKNTKYIVAESCNTQVLWMKQQHMDYEVEAKEIIIFCDNTSVIVITENPFLH